MDDRDVGDPRTISFVGERQVVG